MTVLFKDSLAEITKVFGSTKNGDELNTLFEDMFTPQEVMDIADRIRIIRELKLGKTQREVAEELGISITTVNRGSRILKYGTGGASKFIK